MSQRVRLATLDVLRGFCLLGILVMNIQSFAMPVAAYLNPTVFGSLQGLDGLAWVLGRLLFDCKFLNLFAMLFGASLVLGGDDTRPRRRLAWLIVFGLLHAYGIWYGDVLFTYGVVGMLVVGARTWSPQRQLRLGLVLVSVGPALTLATALAFDHLPHSILDEFLKYLDARTVERELAAFRGDWLTQLPVRATIAFSGQTSSLLYETGWRAAGFMLLGMAALQRGLFAATSLSPRTTLLFWVSGLAVTGAGIAVQFAWGFAPRPWLFAQVLHEVGAVPLALAIGSAVVRLARRFATATTTRAIASLGGVAFTAYLMQSLLGTLLFGGHGLGAFGTWSRATLFLTACAFWTLQVLLARLWSRHFGRGPLEALWRGLVRKDFSLRPRTLHAEEPSP
ncbi:hypothetical protein MYSTI_02187 [Myxococcus stipitatus DSM 14675]|uniref:DUF418 domain-containing protein n=1 Tax=Myxococcus stipitatus (strain DSM 14675 / JCM 12634 / Mx s8) TaxID=1278073 RepID=L7UAP3_MYXSD|nr:DUF418 domain-containing protein [Myxococcus stipitatus]AGC43514.1 hypothetical protein MYSTI_02187 [Myxococcus stipitatus DSM 14675]